MNMMDSVAGMAMDLSASKLAVSYSTAVTKKAMDNQEAIEQNLLQMLPPQPAKGAVIDTYA